MLLPDLITPSPSPTSSLPPSLQFVLPHPNTMAFFEVVPGESFHAVQEVYSEEKMRLSIQGWFHAPEGPQGAELATLAQLQTKEVGGGLVGGGGRGVGGGDSGRGRRRIIVWWWEEEKDLVVFAVAAVVVVVVGVVLAVVVVEGG